MTPQDVKDYFKNGYQFGKQTKMSNNTMKNWIKSGFVPFAQQKKIEKLTEGALIAEWDDRELKEIN